MVLCFWLAGAVRVHAQVQYLGVFDPLRPGTTQNWRLQDFCIFRDAEFTYVAAMNKTDANRIVMGRSRDFQNWEYLGEAIKPPRSADDANMVWAPHVVEDEGTYYMFYTGVNIPSAGQWNQRICVASTTTPADVNSWKRNNSIQFMVNGQAQSWFRPDHAGANWPLTAWADCRDAMVLKHNGTWYMFYSGSDFDGGIAGVATAPSILGPWTDRGAVLKVSAGIPESCFVLPTPDGSWVMTFNHAGASDGGSKIASSTSLLPINGQPSFGNLQLLNPTLGGWAHEFLPGPDAGTFLCAHLTGYYANLRWSFMGQASFGWTIFGADVPDDNCPCVVSPDQTDSDGDGVGNPCDACPNTMAGLPVDASGCSVRVPGDMDRDGDVDQEDFGAFQLCLSGPYSPQSDPACVLARLDTDNDVDKDDAAVFVQCLQGAGVAADPACAR